MPNWLLWFIIYAGAALFMLAVAAPWLAAGGAVAFLIGL